MRGIGFAVLVLLLFAPAGSAAWRGPGSLEPDTRIDREDGRMFPDPPRDPAARRVYFNAWQAVEGTSASPNVALLGTAVIHPAVHQRAMLGEWLDCDRDGYIGNAESALQEYASILADPLLCPAGSRHNDGQWVSEMLAIGMVDPCEYERDPAIRQRDCPQPGNVAEPTVPAFAYNHVVLYSNDTYVWGDVGAPGAIPRAECALAPMPRGTTSGTGSFLRWADCQDGYRVGATVNAVDSDGRLGLRFDDPENPQASQSHLNQDLPVSLLGAPDSRTGVAEQGSGDPAWTAWDCDGRTGVQDPTGVLSEVVLTDPTPGGRLSGPMFPLVLTGYTFRDEDGNGATPGVMRIRLGADANGNLLFVPRPAPAVLDPTGSSWDAAEAGVDAMRGDCDPTTRSDAQTRYPGTLVEDGDQVLPAARKDQSSFVFTFFDGHRGFNSNVDPYTGEGTPSDGGLLVHRHGRGGAGPLWSATSGSTQDPQLVQRGGSGTSTPGLYFTYYARVGADVVSQQTLTLPGTGGRYGMEACGGEPLGWVCDPALWWKGPSGEDVRPYYAKGEVPIGRVPGDPFDLRDVDCYDGAVWRDQDVRASLADLSEDGPCAR